MELTYMVRAEDGKEYGPASVEELSLWIREGRVRAEQDLKRSDMQHWAPARSFSELSASFTPAPASPRAPVTPSPGATTAAAAPSGDAVAAAQCRSGASWFYWIAALSLVNSIIAFTGGTWRFIIGLGITQVIDAFGKGLGASGNGIALLLDLLVAGLFVLFGIFGHKRQAWAFIVGMILFGLDTLFSLLIQDWLGIAFHAFVVYCLFRGFSGCRRLG